MSDRSVPALLDLRRTDTGAARCRIAILNAKILEILRILSMSLVSLGIAGCYMPVRWDAEIEITRTGYYDFIFDGYLAKVNLFDDLRAGKLTPTEEEKRVEQLRTDFQRDGSVREFKYVSQGHFKIHWQREGDLVKARSVTFVRRNEHIFGISYNRNTGLVSMAGRYIKPDQARQLAEMGLNSSGELRVFTDARVVSHNAAIVKDNKRKGGRWKSYIWRVKSVFDPVPKLVIALR